MWSIHKLVACSECRRVFHPDLMRIPFTSRWRKTCAYCGVPAELVEPTPVELETFQRARNRAASVWLMGEVALLVIVILAATLALGADGPRITDNASAIEAAKRWLKARCTTQTPCSFKPEHEGTQWRVWVQLTRRNSPNEAPRPYPGGTLILYFDESGNLTRRLEGD